MTTTHRIALLLIAAALVISGGLSHPLIAASHVTWKQCLSQKDSWYTSDEALRIADNVLLYQRSSGGWPKNTEMAVVLTDKAKSKLRADKSQNDSTIDNGATCRQLHYLARIYTATGRDRFKAAFLKGIDYLLEAQYPNGGWPQFYPLKRGYSTHITFNDGAMINVMTLFSDIRDRKADVVFVDAERRTAATAAVAKGIDCILKCQIVHNGKRLAWCAQHDEKTFQPRPARSYELASLSGSESVGIVEFLMSVDNPSPKVIAAIEDAVRWFEAAKITGIRQISKSAPGTEKGYDKTIIPDAEAPPIWARFYQIGSNRPIFCSRDGVPRDNLADISYERRNGYSWYTSAPSDLLAKSYPAWHEEVNPQGKRPQVDRKPIHPSIHTYSPPGLYWRPTESHPPRRPYPAFLQRRLRPRPQALYILSLHDFVFCGKACTDLVAVQAFSLNHLFACCAASLLGRSGQNTFHGGSLDA